MTNIIQFPNLRELEEKKKTLSNSIKCLEYVALAKLSEMELPFYAKEIPANVIEAARKISWRVISMKERAKKIKSFKTENYCAEIQEVRKTLKFINSASKIFSAGRDYQIFFDAN